MEYPNALTAGSALHEYRIETVLGAGGFGITYLAIDDNLNTKVAIKEYLPNDLAVRTKDQIVQPRSPTVADGFKHGLKRFMEEARTLASFRHAHIVRVLRFFEANQTGYMVMEFVDGQPLGEWARAHRPLTREAVLMIADRILDGLEVVHRAGFLHRDIKPTNIFIRADSSPVLIDFGSARRAGNGAGEITSIVSAGFAPLEQYHANGKQGPWTDIYAFGGVLYWLVTGVQPIEAVARVKEDALVAAEKVGDGRRYGAELLRAIDWALKRNEEDRPQNVADFRKALGLAAIEKTIVVTERLSNNATAAGALSAEEIKQVEIELAKFLGPIANVVVRQAAARAVTVESLIRTLAGEIEDEASRAKFVKRFTSTPTSRPSAPPAPTPSSKFSADLLGQAETALAQYIGAVAKVIVKRAAAKARDETELYLLIADEIESPTERQKFIRKAMSISSRR